MPEFRPGAMENWGLVIFRHQQMCFNPHMDTSLRRGESVINTIVHELAHQVPRRRAIRDACTMMDAVVRRSGDDGVVGRPVAQRGPCRVLGTARCLRHLPRAGEPIRELAAACARELLSGCLDEQDVTATTAILEDGLQFDGGRRRSHPLTDPLGPYFDRITYNKARPPTPPRRTQSSESCRAARCCA